MGRENRRPRGKGNKKRTERPLSRTEETTQEETDVDLLPERVLEWGFEEKDRSEKTPLM